ncbi:TonB-dependent receptor domain-containing protein [Sphingomonas sp. J344]|uniref:TonB-dependent receptor domain-containing protein n=1 Tax=Sphingomonas sp. J344 TaxID=2898434 RepID=UPI0035AFE544
MLSRHSRRTTGELDQADRAWNRYRRCWRICHAGRRGIVQPQRLAYDRLSATDHATRTSARTSRHPGGSPSWRGRAMASWDARGWGASATLNYTHSYLEDIGSPPRRVDAFATIDAQLRFEPKALAERGFRLSLNVQNLLDARPPFVDQMTGVGYGAANADPLGRILSIQVVKRW